MGKRFSTTYANGYTVETSAAHEAVNFVNHGEGQSFFLFGKIVNAEEFFATARKVAQSAFNKKCETHKQISVQHGVTPSARVTIWVRK